MRLFYQLLSFSILSLLIFSPRSGLAASSEWQDLGAGKARLVALANPDDGSIDGVIEVKLDKGWKTYWRSPGDSGIPPRFDFGQSKGVFIDGVMFPAPYRVDNQGDIISGYKEYVAFPFHSAKPDDENGEISLNMIIGVCEVICIPATAQLQLPLTGTHASNFADQAIIDKARLSLPQEGGDQVRVQSMTVANKDQLETKIAFPDETVDAKDVQLFIEDGDISWFKASLASEIKPGENGKAIATFTTPFRMAKDDLNVAETPLKLTLRAGERSWVIDFQMNQDTVKN